MVLFVLYNSEPFLISVMLSEIEVLVATVISTAASSASVAIFVAIVLISWGISRLLLVLLALSNLGAVFTSRGIVCQGTNISLRLGVLLNFSLFMMMLVLVLMVMRVIIMALLGEKILALGGYQSRNKGADV